MVELSHVCASVGGRYVGSAQQESRDSAMADARELQQRGRAYQAAKSDRSHGRVGLEGLKGCFGLVGHRAGKITVEADFSRLRRQMAVQSRMRETPVNCRFFG